MNPGNKWGWQEDKRDDEGWKGEGGGLKVSLFKSQNLIGWSGWLGSPIPSAVIWLSPDF